MAGKVFKIIELSSDGQGDGDRVAVRVFEAALEKVEKTAATRNGKRHTAKLAQDLVPFFKGDPGTALKLIENYQKAGVPMSRKCQDAEKGIDNPPKEDLSGCIEGIPSEKKI
jgi:hypothetical protein